MNLKASTACRHSAKKITFAVLVSIRAFLCLLYPARVANSAAFLVPLVRKAIADPPGCAETKGLKNEIRYRAFDRLAGGTTRHCGLSQLWKPARRHRRCAATFRGEDRPPAPARAY